MWRLSRSISRFLRKIQRNRYHNFWSKCDSIPILYHPKGTGNQWRSQNGVLHPRESDHAECREAYFLTPNIEVKNPSQNRALEGLVIGARGNRMGFTPMRVQSRRVWSLYLYECDQAECRGVYILNSEHWGAKNCFIDLLFCSYSRLGWIPKSETTGITEPRFSRLVFPPVTQPTTSEHWNFNVL